MLPSAISALFFSMAGQPIPIERRNTMGVNVYDVINQRILQLLEQGTVPWRRGWNVTSSMPRSLATKKEYKGLNVFVLSCQQFSSPWWLTFHQCNQLGGRILKGSRSTPVLFWKWVDRAGNELDVHDEHNSRSGKVPLLKFYQVFNAEQTEGITYPETENTFTNFTTFTPIEQAEQIISSMPNRPLIQHMGNRAYYNPTSDTITLPPQHNFQSPEEYYCTAFHELIHSTMAENRLNRKATIQVHKFGDADYSKEELVAEMGASFLCGYSGIEDTTLENSVAYLQGWLKALRSDRTLLVHAASAAQRASDFVLNVTPTTED
jgi:antirestriction protein ArdC